MKNIKKKMISTITIGLLAIPMGSLFASSLDANKNEKKFLYVSVDTQAGQEILKSEMEYKEYLNKKLDKDTAEKPGIDAYNELKNLKKAVAKLILEQSEKGTKTMELDSISNKIKNLEEADTRFNLQLMEIKNMINGFKDSKIFMLNKHAAESKPSKIENEYVSKKYTQEELNFSFMKIQEKEFTVQSNSVYFYKNPVLGEKALSKKLQGESFIADMYTNAGWVHAKDHGWVKGYFLLPKVLPGERSLKNIEYK